MNRFSSKTLPKSFKELFTFSRFFIVGGMGFTVDFAVLSFCMYVLDMSPIWARIPSSIIAILVTWFLNMTFTFKAKPQSKKKSLMLYGTVKSVGFLINFGIYTVLLLIYSYLYANPFFALVISSAIAMVFNFYFARKVFEKT